MDKCATSGGRLKGGCSQDWLPHTGRRNRLPHQIWSAACFVTLSSLLSAVSSGAEVPDVIYYNGNIVTMSASQRRAQAVAIKANRFLLTGSDAEVRKLAAPETKQIDLHGKTVLPGLEDSHTHPITAALSERDGPIPVMNSIAEIQEYI